MIGSYSNYGGSTQYGPFLDVAPEDMHNSFPYMTFNIIGPGNLDQGFANVYAEKPVIRFHFYDTDPQVIGYNVEYFCARFDLQPIINLNGMDQVRSIIRREPPQLVADTINENGQRVYHWVVAYEFRVVRIKGYYYNSWSGYTNS